MKIVRNRDRVKKTGEVFTPEWLVDEMLMKLAEQDETLFTNPDKTFLEPACGDGNFLVRILHFKIEFFKAANPDKEVPIECILKSIYGIDLMPDNVMRAKDRMIEVIKNELVITDEKQLKKLRNILENDDTKYGNIVQGDGLKWDFDNWCPKESVSRIEHETEGTIAFENDSTETTVDDTLASLGNKSEITKPQRDIFDGDDIFSFD